MHYHVLFCIYNWNYCGTFVVPKFLLPLETLDFTGVYLPVDFNVGTTFFELSIEVHRGVPEAIDHISLNP